MVKNSRIKNKTKTEISNLLSKIRKNETHIKLLKTRVRTIKANSRTNQNIVNNRLKMRKKGLSFKKRRSKKFKKNNPGYNQGNN